MRPVRSFLWLLIFLAGFTGLHYLVTPGNLFPPVTEFIPDKVINALLPAGHGPEDTEQEVAGDTIRVTAESHHEHIDSSHVVTSSYITGLLPLFPDSSGHDTNQIRIVYYGDSQIEGDRITSYLRTALRQRYAGTGPGLVQPLMPVMYTKSVWVRSSSNWKRYNYLSYRAGDLSHRELGPFMSVCRFLPEGESADVPQKASVRIRPSNVADSASAIYDILRIMYGKVQDIVTVTVKDGDRLVMSDTLRIGEGFMELECRLDGAGDIVIEFEGRSSPDIYGISIEGPEGIVVDNIPQRGSAGLEFTMVDRDNLAAAFAALDPDLIILHYGLNVVKNVREEYTYYQQGLERQISLLKELVPHTPVLVISLTDMAHTEGDSVKSYVNIPAIVDAQREAAYKQGAAFWDSYDAMGGESSIMRWAEKSPPLAQRDYVHFTYEGADSMAAILVNSLFITDDEESISPEIKTITPDTPDNIMPEDIAGDDHYGNVRNILRVTGSYLTKYDPAKPFIFSVPAFWIFFLIVLAGYSLLYRKMFLRNAYLFIVSLFFYYKSGGFFLFLLIFITVVDFVCGLLIYNSRKKGTKRIFVLISVVSNLGMLAYFKYTGFIIDTINNLLGTNYEVYDILASFSNSFLGTSFDITTIILPVGISFFTFQSLSYIFDLNRGKINPVRNIIDFAFYVSFFPQLVAGPIVRASEFIPQLYRRYRLNEREFSHALFLILKGLIKKIVISDFIAVNFIDRIFDAPAIYSGFENLMAVYGYGLQIYCDFSGYTDIAIGLGLIMGFRFPVNFNSPYKAYSVTDFWRRWHISLSRWLKDYLYIPLGGSRRGRLRTGINLLVTMLLGGLWHGAAMRFVIWGGLHGAGLIINKIWDTVRGHRIKYSRLGRAVSVFITFNFVTFCWIFFRSESLGNVSIMLKQITGNFSPGSYISVLPAYSNVFLLIAAGYIIHFLPERIKEAYRGLFIRIPLVVKIVVVFLVAVMLYQMKTAEVMPFIYFRF